MQHIRPRGRAGAFTLIELLVVIAILSILLVMVLPALTRGRAQARRVECAGQLRQDGMGFHLFAHDHSGLFPMQVPIAAGGSLEFVQNAHQSGAEFYFSFRHFQALSNELVSPRLVLCPADTARRPAESFAALNNNNLSYFVAVNADFQRPTSLLAGDRNITNHWAPAGTIQRLESEYGLGWTEELHRFKGNLLFADGHVEQRSGPRLVLAKSQLAAPAEVFLPSIRNSSGGSAAVAASATVVGLAVESASTTTNGAQTGVELPSAPNAAPASSLVRAASPAAELLPAAPESSVSSTSSPARAAPPHAVRAKATASPQVEEAAAPPFDEWLTAWLDGSIKKGGWLLFLLLIALMLLTLELRRRRQLRQRARRRLAAQSWQAARSVADEP